MSVEAPGAGQASRDRARAPSPRLSPTFLAPPGPQGGARGSRGPRVPPGACTPSPPVRRHSLPPGRWRGRRGPPVGRPRLGGAARGAGRRSHLHPARGRQDQRSAATSAASTAASTTAASTAALSTAAPAAGRVPPSRSAQGVAEPPPPWHEEESADEEEPAGSCPPRPAGPRLTGVDGWHRHRRRGRLRRDHRRRRRRRRCRCRCRRRRRCNVRRWHRRGWHRRGWHRRGRQRGGRRRRRGGGRRGRNRQVRDDDLAVTRAHAGDVGHGRPGRVTGWRGPDRWCASRGAGRSGGRGRRPSAAPAAIHGLEHDDVCDSADEISAAPAASTAGHAAAPAAAMATENCCGRRREGRAGGRAASPASPAVTRGRTCCARVTRRRARNGTCAHVATYALGPGRRAAGRTAPLATGRTGCAGLAGGGSASACAPLAPGSGRDLTLSGRRAGRGRRISKSGRCDRRAGTAATGAPSPAGDERQRACRRRTDDARGAATPTPAGARIRGCDRRCRPAVGEPPCRLAGRGVLADPDLVGGAGRQVTGRDAGDLYLPSVTTRSGARAAACRALRAVQGERGARHIGRHGPRLRGPVEGEGERAGCAALAGRRARRRRVGRCAGCAHGPDGGQRCTEPGGGQGAGQQDAGDRTRAVHARRPRGLRTVGRPV